MVGLRQLFVGASVLPWLKGLIGFAGEISPVAIAGKDCGVAKNPLWPGHFR